MRKLTSIKEDKRSLKLKDSVNTFTVQKRLYEKNILRNDQTGVEDTGVCINCEEKPCYQFKKTEINPHIISGLTYNNTQLVCPTDAINSDGEFVQIDPATCIGCGLCAARCPIGGISIDDKEFTATINFEANGLFEEIESTDLPSIESLLDRISNTSQENSAIKKKHVAYFHQSLSELIPKMQHLELLIIRNYCIILGLNCKVGAKGNNDNRLDFIGINGTTYYPGEVELRGNDILGLPRRILENIAILKNRYQVEEEDQVPILFVGSFPNKRSDFYEVLKDILNVLNIKVRTLSVHQLFCIVLIGENLSPSLISNSYIDVDSADLSPKLMAELPALSELDPEFGGLFYSPAK